MVRKGIQTYQNLTITKGEFNMSLLDSLLPVLENNGKSSKEVLFVTDGLIRVSWNKFCNQVTFEELKRGENPLKNQKLSVVGEGWNISLYSGVWEYYPIPNYETQLSIFIA